MQKINIERNKEIYSLRKQGWSATAIGERYHLSAGRVSTICSYEVVLEEHRNRDDLWQLICGSEESFLQVSVYKILRRNKINTVADLRENISDIISGNRLLPGISKKRIEYLQSIRVILLNENASVDIFNEELL